ncbi:class IV adenylate cyclase [Leeuwenhoekiella sp. NPDC079379]|uniref:class IV adenylate cyclase n=1 Tax=Leeuwenhoekiella sp. NPDC079379 TaxID=3364122 RepID=UPI0037CB267D
MYEVELKAKLKNYEFTKTQLIKQNPVSTYRAEYYDRYYDLNNALNSTEQELRLRTKTVIETTESKHFLTFKDTPFDLESKSKQEYETQVLNPENTNAIVKHLGYSKTLSYTKHCEIFNFIYEGFQLEVALVMFDNLKEAFLEIEILTPYQNKTDAVFKVLHNFLEGVNITKDQLTTAYYVDLFKKRDN